MTTKELLDSVTFKEIAPYLSRYLGNAPYDFYGPKGDCPWRTDAAA